jgi:hypothetical protein
MPVLTCTRCKASLPFETFNRPGWQPCRSCDAQVRVVAFPALLRERSEGQGGESIEAEGESSCFFHPKKKAVVPCDSCGRFLCSLCDLELHGQHLCPQCLETGTKKGKLKNLENHRVLYDSIALAMAVLPLLIFYFTIFTAPAAIYVAIRYRNAPTSVVPRWRRTRFVLALVLSSLQIAGWMFGLGYFLFH